MAPGLVNDLADVLHAEASALSHAIVMADHLGVDRVLFETDSLTLQHVVSSNSYDYPPLGHLFHDIKYKLNTQFIQAEVVHVGRSCNKPAHVLATMGAGLVNGEACLWLDSFPVDVSCVVTGSSAVI